MNDIQTDITADAIALQERDEFRALGWLKLVAPAKVNLHLGIGPRREDGYHDAATVMHALNLHDVVYMRRSPEGLTGPVVRMIGQGDVVAPDVPQEDNIAVRAIRALAERVGRTDDTALEMRIEKNIPSQAGLGGGSSDAAAALVGAAHLWGLDPRDPAVEETARLLGADVAFFLHGGCAYLEGTGGSFVHTLAPSRKSVALVKPAGGVSTAEAYRAFDEHPDYASSEQASSAANAASADEVGLFNGLTGASERLMPELGEVRSWLEVQQGVASALLCGSGSCTFAPCDDFSTACRIVAEARQRGWWARATSFGSIRAMIVSTE